MIEHRNDKQRASDDGIEFKYKFNDSEWRMLLSKFEKNQAKFSPLMRNNISKLIRSMTVSRMITTVQQANTIIALLLCKEETQEQDAQEQIDDSFHDAELKVYDDKKLAETNEIIERIRMLIMHYQVYESRKEICQGRERR